MRKLYCSSLSGWYCVAKFDKENKKISWIPKDDGPGSKLKKGDIEIIQSALISKKVLFINHVKIWIYLLLKWLLRRE